MESSVIIVMGVAGSGKSTVGDRLARRLEWPFYEGDDYHPTVNVDKMSQGIALTDSDRQPWLATLGHLLHDLQASNRSAVLSCSALKQTYRTYLRHNHPHLHFVYLRGSRTILKLRLERRQHHFASAQLLDSQLATLEEPTDSLTVSIDADPDTIVATIVTALSMVPRS